MNGARWATAQGTAGRGVRCDDRNVHSRGAGLHLGDLHPVGKREQWVSFHHDLVSLSTQSDGPFWKEVYHTFSLLLISAIPDSPKSAMSQSAGENCIIILWMSYLEHQDMYPDFASRLVGCTSRFTLHHQRFAAHIPQAFLKH